MERYLNVHVFGLSHSMLLNSVDTFDVPLLELLHSVGDNELSQMSRTINSKFFDVLYFVQFSRRREILVFLYHSSKGSLIIITKSIVLSSSNLFIMIGTCQYVITVKSVGSILTFIL